MTEFRRRQNSDRWHWSKDCSNYPTEQNVIISHTYRKRTELHGTINCRGSRYAHAELLWLYVEIFYCLFNSGLCGRNFNLLLRSIL